MDALTPVNRPLNLIFWRTISLALAFALTAAGPASAQTGLSATEIKCSSKLAKTASKLASTYLKEMSRCRDAVMSGKVAGPCPDSATLSRIQGAIEKLESTVSKSCTSTCSVSGLQCVSDALCPPLGNADELCSAGAKGRLFDMGNLGFPGAHCELAIGKPITSWLDISNCVSALSQDAGDAMIAAIYGGLDISAFGNKDLQRCVGAISKSAQKIVSTTFKGAIKCHNSINKGKLERDPRRCSFEDAKTVSKLGKAKTKLRAAVEKRCDSPTVLAALDVCGLAGGGVPLDIEAVATCVIEATSEITDSLTLPALRIYGPTSFLDAVYPPQPVCGDNIVNQGPNAFLPLGEECDGAAGDDACPGLCLPPGDLFECTCADQPRLRFLGDATFVDLDIGWAGAFHDLRIAKDAGFVAEMSDCDCDDMNGATCEGASSDSVCNLQGSQLPRCEWDTDSSTRCDAHGNGNSVDTDNDCFVCDAFADNAGEFCVNSGDCESRCYDFFDTPLGPCTTHEDCGSGAVCRGRCDNSMRCLEIPNGAPTPSSSGGLGACTVTVYREDVSGTTDIVTGAHEIDMLQYSRVHTGVTSSTPCPVCGGFCDGGPLDGESCLGRCSFGNTPCRVNSDCGGTQICNGTSPDCPSGECNLAQICSAGLNEGAPCRVEAVNPVFGAVSSDCLPAAGLNITGSGLTINWQPRTSELVDAPAELPCTSPGFELYTCACPSAGGALTKPNPCAAACDAGPELGTGCAIGNTSGVLTTCTGGVNEDRACDEDSDCPGGSCSNNPTHCVGDPTFDLNSCSTNADCGLGSCVDACPSGRCVPLCIADPSDPEDGICAAGPPTYHCSGASDSFRICGVAEAEGDCSATCNKTGTACNADSQCPVGESCEGQCNLARLCEAGLDGVLGTADDNPEAGICISDDRQCPRFGIEGGDTDNGEGDPTNVRTVAAFCLNATGISGVNETAGIGGPGRLRQKGTNVTNGLETLPSSP